MEELLGRKIKVIMNSTSGFMVITGELVRIEHPFYVIRTQKQDMYLSVDYIKSIEIV